MSSVKALPLGHVTTPMYVVMDRPVLSEMGSLKGGSPPLAGTRGYPYPQDPSRAYAPPPPHLLPPHLYRDPPPHFQVDARQPTDGHHIDRYNDQHVQHVRRRLSLRPTPEYNVAIDRERYMDAIRLQYEREQALGVSGAYGGAGRAIKPLVVSVHTPPLEPSDSGGLPVKRPRLAQEPKPALHQPLLIDTRVMKKEAAYTPQVEAISPTLPSEEGRCESPLRNMKDNIVASMNRIDKEINQIEAQIIKLRKKKDELELEAAKPSTSKEVVADEGPVESKEMSTAQLIYTENRKKAQDSLKSLETLGPKVEIPLYNQPCDTALYHENKRRHQIFKSRLLKCFKKRHRKKDIREKHLSETYSKLQQEWLKRVEKKENNPTKKAKDAKLREFFEKQFPELKKQREDKERISRVSTRIRSESEWEEIIDGLQEQENEEKKMRSYAVIPPILEGCGSRSLRFENQNGLVEDLATDHKELQQLNVWSDSEKAIFREKYLQHPKNFAFIASFLERKTVQDCVQYYYLSKKGENYKQLLRKHNVRKRRAMVKQPQTQPPPVSQSSGVTTRQQVDPKTLVSLCNTAVSGSETRIQSSTSECTTTSSTPLPLPSTTIDSSSSCTVSTTVVTETTPAPTAEPTRVETIHLPNNIRKKKEAARLAEVKEEQHSDSDTNDQSNMNIPPQPCAVCKVMLENPNQSRPLTKVNCALFGVKESDLVDEMRVCANCRFKSVRRKCPLPSCKTPKRKVKRLRSLPPKLAELPAETRDAITSELQIPADVNKCCSACFNRITRKVENNPGDGESSESSRWTDEEIETAKNSIRQHGSNWDAVSALVGTRTKEQCRSFFFSYKHKLGLDEILQEFLKVKGDDGLQDVKPPPLMSDEESGETTSSCDEDDRADRCSSDTASAPSPVDKILIEDKNESLRVKECLPDPVIIPTMSLPEEPPRPRALSLISEPSPKCPPDYDSSATVSADEGDPCPRLLHHSVLKMDRKHFQSPLPLPLPSKDPQESIPLVKTLLQDPKIGVPASTEAGSAFAAKANKDEPTCVRDLIYQAIEFSLQWGAKPGRNSSPIPSSMSLGLSKESGDLVIVEPKKEDSGAFPPSAHGGSRHSSRPPSHHMEPPPVECEVQDLSRKVKSRDVSPVKDFVKRERSVTPARPPSGPSSMLYGQYGTPPPAHCNQFRSSQPPPALSPHYVAEPPHHESSYFPRSSESARGKGYVPSERPPHLVAQSASVQQTPKPIPVKATAVPPPPPLVASKPSQMSPKMPYKVTAGSITQGTPVNQSVPPTNLSSARYEPFLRQLPPPQSKDGGGSITLGTPVQHEVKRVPTTRPDGGYTTQDGSIVRPAVYDPNVVEFYRQVTPNGQQYPFPPGYGPGFQGGVPPQRPPYANESQLSSNQIRMDFITSKQMATRKWPVPEKDPKVSPRGSDPNPAPPPQDHHPMYPPANYQGREAAHYNHSYPPGDSRYGHHRSPAGSPMDRTRSPSGIDPGKRSPSLSVAQGRQNVIHRSITWGTGKPSVIQAPQSQSPRTQEQAMSPASIRKSTPSPRHPQPILYPAMPPSGHDAFNTLVNAAVAQPSLAVPAKDGKGSPSPSVLSRQDVKSPRDRPVVEGLEKSLIEMHQRPRSYTDSGPGLERVRTSPPEHPSPVLGERERYPHAQYPQRISEKQHQMMMGGEQPNTLRLGSMREPFSREQFERQMRQNPNASTRERAYPPPPQKKEEERPREPQNYASQQPQQSDLDNEASKIFSQSFQKDAPRTNASPRGFTAANLIDAIITRQINQNVDTPATPKVSSIDIFGGQYHSGYEENKAHSQKPNGGKRTEVVTIDDEPESEKGTSHQWSSERGPGSHVRSPPNSGVGMPPGMTQSPYPPPNDKVYTLSDHIAAIISKDYNSPSDMTQAQPHFSSSSQPGGTSVSHSARSSPYVPHNAPGDKFVEGGDGAPHGGLDHGSQSWKLRRALQQEHRSPAESAHKRPPSNHSSETMEERQIIRVAQNSPVSRRSSPTGPYGVEPISPPTQNESEGPSRVNQGPPPAWANNPSITNLLTSRHMYPQEIPDQPHFPAPNRPPHQQQMGLSPFDYVKNRIVEAMRTASDTEPESSVRPQEERDHPLPQSYRYPPVSEQSERPLSTGNVGPPLLQGQRYSPTVSRYSPIPPRPASAVERVPSRNSTPGEPPRQHKRGPDGHIIPDWREGPNSRTSSRSVSPSADHPDSANRKKTRAEGTFIPESGLDRAPVLLPQNAMSIHRSGSISEAPRLSSNEHQRSIVSPRTHPHPESDPYKYRDGATSSTSEAFSPSTKPPDMPRQSPEQSPSPQGGHRSTPGLYTPFGPPNGGVSSSTMYSTGTSLPPPASPHVSYANFPGMSNTYAYPYSALTVRGLSNTQNSVTNPVTSHIPVTSTHMPPVVSRTATSPLARNTNQPPPLLSAQYEPLSDED